MALTFYLGTHRPGWLGLTDVPLFISHRRLREVRRPARAQGPWCLDSGGFTELSQHGRWVTPQADYVAAVRRYAAEIGGLQWAAIQDWMCEPEMLKKTGLDVEEHQRRTVVSYIELRAAAPEIPWCPVLQGWAWGDHERHVEMYEAMGAGDLRAVPIVGVGSICRRQNTIRASLILSALKAEGLRLHGFGFKMQGLEASASDLASADSMAWSINGKKNGKQPDCAKPHCGNCLHFALDWRARLLDRVTPASRHPPPRPAEPDEDGPQLGLF